VPLEIDQLVQRCSAAMRSTDATPGFGQPAQLSRFDRPTQRPQFGPTSFDLELRRSAWRRIVRIRTRC